MDRLPARLLAGRDRPSIVEKEAMLAAILPEKSRSRRWLWLAAPSMLAAAAAVFLVLWSRNHDEFYPRGGPVTNARLALTCPTGCSAGRKVVFDLHGTAGYRYFAAFARTSDGDVIWYFPQPNGTSERVADVLARTIVFGPEHRPGRYTVYGVYSVHPLTREAIKARFDAMKTTAGPDTKVVVVDLVVQ